MEPRERPEYFPPIEPRRRGFPWLGLIGVMMLVLAGFAVKQHVETQAAWNARFGAKAKTQPAAAVPATPEELAELQRKEWIERIRRQRAQAEFQVKRYEQRAKERANWKCIDHTPFRPIPGGWENVPGERC